MNGTDGTSEEEVKLAEKERESINRDIERADTEKCPGPGRMQGEGVGPSKGKLIGDTKSLEKDELDFVQEQVRLGRTVEIIPTSKIKRQRTPDFHIDGQRIELKTVSGIKNTSAGSLSGGIASRIMDGRGQAGDIVVNANNQAGLTQEIAERATRRAFGADTKRGINSIKIIGSDFEILVPRQ